MSEERWQAHARRTGEGRADAGQAHREGRREMAGTRGGRVMVEPTRRREMEARDAQMGSECTKMQMYCKCV